MHKQEPDTVCMDLLFTDIDWICANFISMLEWTHLITELGVRTPREIDGLLPLSVNYTDWCREIPKGEHLWAFEGGNGVLGAMGGGSQLPQPLTPSLDTFFAQRKYRKKPKDKSNYSQNNIFSTDIPPSASADTGGTSPSPTEFAIVCYL